MKKLFAILISLCLLCTAFAAAADGNEPFAFENGVKFGMTQDEVIAAEGNRNYKKDTEHTHGPVTFAELEYEDIIDEATNAKADRKYLFVDGKLAAVRMEYETKHIAYETLKEKLGARGEFAVLDTAALGNGIFAVDDDGTPEKNVLAFADGNVMVVLELDDEGDDIDVTFVDLTASYIR